MGKVVSLPMGLALFFGITAINAATARCSTIYILESSGNISAFVEYPSPVPPFEPIIMSDYYSGPVFSGSWPLFAEEVFATGPSGIFAQARLGSFNLFAMDSVSGGSVLAVAEGRLSTSFLVGPEDVSVQCLVPGPGGSLSLYDETAGIELCPFYYPPDVDLLAGHTYDLTITLGGGMTGTPGGLSFPPSVTFEQFIPEPLTMVAVGMGIATLGGYIRRRRVAAK